MEYTLKVGDKCYLLSNRDLAKKQFIMITARGAGKKSLIDTICSTLASEWVAAGLIQKKPNMPKGAYTVPVMYSGMV